ncbi:antitoxin Xre/MbcA/ParS toxin-binding domain-containing protein [Pontibacter toksunensis]|uniref:Antitoxin Xre/MbcA/ParS toxin-binding domain-containing protein n=1 Tax=Pontibacter toksunensis TaxID=1332631 RepID=A0ABW6BTE2_9BACT
MKPLRGRKKSAPEVESAELTRFEPVVQDSFSLVMAAREGVLAKVAFEVADRLLLHLSQMADILHITTKTLQSYKQSKKKLNPANSEQTLKLFALQMKGKEVFGAADAFRRWLEKPAYGLDGQVPLDLLETSGGIDLVMEELERIAYGDLA